MAWDDGIDPLSLIPAAGLEELTKRLVKGLLSLRPAKLPGRSVGTGITQIAHGQRKGIPRLRSAIPQSNATVWQPQQPDAQFIYLQASVACVVDVTLDL